MRAIDLFCGTGGLSKGLRNSGMEILAGYDHWPAAVETCSWNLRHPVEILDLLDVDEAVRRIKRMRAEIIVGGPPCQDFSTAGKRKEGEKANLTAAFAAIVVACKPDMVLMENVPQVRNSHTYRKARDLLGKAGYVFHEQVLDASFCRVPQIRKRFFMVGWRAGMPFSKEGLTERMEKSRSKKRMTVSEYMKDEMDIQYYYRHPRNYARRAIFSVHEPSPTIRGVNRPVPPNYKRNHLDSAPAEQVRSLTFHERSRIQTFPKAWKWQTKEKTPLQNRHRAADRQCRAHQPCPFRGSVRNGHSQWALTNPGFTA